MSATHQPAPESPREPSGEQIFFAMAAAFLVMVVVIIGGFFLPIGAAIGMIAVALAIVITIVLVFLARAMRD